MDRGLGAAPFTVCHSLAHDARGSCRRRNAATRALALIAALLLQGAPPSPAPELMRLQVGTITVITPANKTGIGTALGEAADQPHDWLGLGRMDAGELTIAVAPDVATFARWSRGKVPSWGAGLMIPGAHLIVVRLDGGDPYQTLRHELAHVVLHRKIPGRVPLWFDEGYASYASGEYGRMAALRLNLTVATGRVPDLRTLDGLLRGDGSDAELGYALAASAVADLARRNPTGQLNPIMDRLAAGMSFDEAVRTTTGLAIDQFDDAWHRRVRQEYNWVMWLVTGGAWLVMTLVLSWAAASRRRRERPRRAELDVGWTLPVDDEEITEPQLTPPQLDREESGR